MMRNRIQKVVLLVSMLSLVFSGVAAARRLPGSSEEIPVPISNSGVLSPVSTPQPGEEFLIYLPFVSQTVPIISGLSGLEYAVWEINGGVDQVWASVSIKDEDLKWVTGLSLDDFELTESLYSPQDEFLEERTITFDCSECRSQFHGDGFWERSVTDEKLDIVILISYSRLMDKYAIAEQMRAFVDRLLKQHVDFRISFSYFGTDYDRHYEVQDFLGVMESAEIYSKIDSDIESRLGGYTTPTIAYDILLRAAQLDFRPEARKVLVMLSDTVPQTVYGNYWSRTLNPSVATLSVSEIFFENKDFEIYYSQPDACEPVPCGEEPCNPEPCDPDPDQIQYLEYYTAEHTNPRAGCMKLQDGSWDCGFNSIATKISWPFQQQEIPLKGGEIADSRYYFAWQSGIYEPSGATDYRMRITICTPDPDRTGEFLEGVFEYPPNVVKKAPVVFTVTDEAGDTIANDFLINLLYMMGDRKAYMAFIDPERLTTENVPVGDYALLGQRDSGGILLPGLHEVDYVNRDQITVPEQGLTTSVQLDFRYQEQDLAIARGLLRDLDDWRVAGDPFGDFVQQAEAWLDEIERDGLTFEEAVALKRFYMTLSGYANMTEYAQLQSEGAIEDVQRMVQDFRDIVEQVDALRGDTLDSWEEELAAGLLDIIYNFFTYGEFQVLKEAVETALEELATYIATEIADEIRQLIMEQIPDGPYKAFIQILINVCIDADFEDWDAAVVAIQDLLLDEALDELMASLAEDFVAKLFSDLDLDGPLEEAIADLIESVLAALIGDGFTDFGQVLDKFSHDVGVYVQQNGHTKVKQAVNEVFDQLEAQLPAGEVRDFLVGITRDLVLQAIPTVKGGQLNYDIDNDVLANVLVKHALYNVVLKEYYVKEARTGMFASLDRARHYVLEDETSYDQESSIRSDYMDYTTVIKGLQDPAWNALSVQDDIESWAKLLEGLTTILDVLSSPLDVIAAVYPPLEDTADAVHGLIAALDSAQIITRAIEFGLKLECLDKFADQVEPLYLIMFPDPG